MFRVTAMALLPYPDCGCPCFVSLPWHYYFILIVAVSVSCHCHGIVNLSWLGLSVFCVTTMALLPYPDCGCPCFVSLPWHCCFILIVDVRVSCHCHGIVTLSWLWLSVFRVTAMVLLPYPDCGWPCFVSLPWHCYLILIVAVCVSCHCHGIVTLSWL